MSGFYMVNGVVCKADSPEGAIRAYAALNHITLESEPCLSDRRVTLWTDSNGKRYGVFLLHAPVVVDAPSGEVLIEPQLPKRPELPTKHVKVRMTPREYGSLVAAARKHNLSVGEFLLKRGLGEL